MLEAGAEDSAFGSAGERTKSCGLLAPGRVRSCGLPRGVRPCGLLGLTPGGYPPKPWASAGRRVRKKIAIVALNVAGILLIVRLLSERPSRISLDWLGFPKLT